MLKISFYFEEYVHLGSVVYLIWSKSLYGLLSLNPRFYIILFQGPATMLGYLAVSGLILTR